MHPLKCIITPILSCQTSSRRVPCQFHNVHCRHCKVTIFIPEYLVSSTRLHCKHCKVTNLHFRVPCQLVQREVHCKHCKVTISIPILASTDWAEEANWFRVSGEQRSKRAMPHYLLSMPSKCIWSSCKPIKPLRSPSQMCVRKANFVANFSWPLFFWGHTV